MSWKQALKGKYLHPLYNSVVIARMLPPLNLAILKKARVMSQDYVYIYLFGCLLDAFPTLSLTSWLDKPAPDSRRECPPAAAGNEVLHSSVQRVWWRSKTAPFNQVAAHILACDTKR